MHLAMLNGKTRVSGSRESSPVSRRYYVIHGFCYLLNSLISSHSLSVCGLTQPKRQMAQKRYSPTRAPSLSMSELLCKTLDCDATDLLIDKWLEHRNDAYWDWFQQIRERKHAANAAKKGQVLLWNKGPFVPENIFCRTVDTGRLIPLDRTWSTHVYYHKSMNDRKNSMMPVVYTMVGSCSWDYCLLRRSKCRRPVAPRIDALTGDARSSMRRHLHNSY